MTDQCSDCIHAFVGGVKVDFDGPGYLDFECEMERAMTDEDCEMCNEGRCPYYKQMEDIPKIGTFEWVLARVRHGAEYSQFRRAGWGGSYAVLDMSEGPAIIDTRYPAYEDAYIRMLDGSDVTADDWEEVD